MKRGATRSKRDLAARAATPPSMAGRERLPKKEPAQPAVRHTARSRIEGLDALRGLAIVAMIVYHFCFDLRYFRITRWDFEHDVGWLAARAAILSSFLVIAGISAVLAERQHRPLAHWLRHIGIIAVAALLVSGGSFLMFPRSFIWFGVLHAIALSLLLAKPLLHRPVLAALTGMAVIVTGIAYSNPLFDQPMLGWIGFMTAKPLTEDYVPLFPWMGVLLMGVALGHALVHTRFTALAPLRRLPPLLRLLGRHSLIVYLLHQPLLLGAMGLIAGM